jgi:hypothetical protein
MLMFTFYFIAIEIDIVEFLMCRERRGKTVYVVINFCDSMWFFCEWKQICAGFYWLSIPVFSLEIQLSDGG